MTSAKASRMSMAAESAGAWSEMMSHRTHRAAHGRTGTYMPVYMRSWSVIHAVGPVCAAVVDRPSDNADEESDHDNEKYQFK